MRHLHSSGTAHGSQRRKNTPLSFWLWRSSVLIFMDDRLSLWQTWTLYSGGRLWKTGRDAWTPWIPLSGIRHQSLLTLWPKARWRWCCFSSFAVDFKRTFTWRHSSVHLLWSAPVCNRASAQHSDIKRNRPPWQYCLFSRQKMFTLVSLFLFAPWCFLRQNLSSVYQIYFLVDPKYLWRRVLRPLQDKQPD